MEFGNRRWHFGTPARDIAGKVTVMGIGRVMGHQALAGWCGFPPTYNGGSRATLRETALSARRGRDHLILKGALVF